MLAEFLPLVGGPGPPVEPVPALLDPEATVASSSPSDCHSSGKVKSREETNVSTGALERDMTVAVPRDEEDVGTGAGAEMEARSRAGGWSRQVAQRETLGADRSIPVWRGGKVKLGERRTLWEETKRRDGRQKCLSHTTHNQLFKRNPTSVLPDVYPDTYRAKKTTGPTPPYTNPPPHLSTHLDRHHSSVSPT